MQGAPELSLEDLFVPRSNSNGLTGRHAGSATLSPILARDWTRWLAASGQLPDTPFVAAWLLLQSRWLGSPRAVHGPVAVEVDAARAASAWLADWTASAARSQRKTPTPPCACASTQPPSHFTWTRPRA